MSPEMLHSTVLVLTITFSFLLVQTPLYRYELQITAFVFIVYFLLKKLRPVKEDPLYPSILSTHRLIDSIVFTFIIVNIVNSTGGLTSDLFFLHYFLIFALSLLLEPVISITATTALIILYLATNPGQQTLSQFLPLFSLPFLTPFALFLGREYQRVLRQRRLIKALRQKSSALSRELGKEQEQSFLFLSLVMKNHIDAIKEAVENFMGDHELRRIEKTVRRMERLIDEYENSSQ